MHELGYQLEDLRDAEWDAGLGNGGLGRLAACFLDSLATLALPAYGYGIRYEYGMFHQRIVNGAQVETPDAWLRYGNPWEIPRPARPLPRASSTGACTSTSTTQGRLTHPLGRHRRRAGARRTTRPCPGYRNGTVNTLRLWSARATRGVRPERLQRRRLRGGRRGARHAPRTSPRCSTRTTTSSQGRELRLKQEYFFVARRCRTSSAATRSAARCSTSRGDCAVFDRFAEKIAIQLNDTHPALAIPELMRLLVDVEELDWETAWEMTTQDLRVHEPHRPARGARALAGERCSAAVLPRHLQLIYEINHRFLERGAPAVSGTTTTAAGACRSSRRTASSACAWRISPSWAATPSTAWRRCTRTS